MKIHGLVEPLNFICFGVDFSGNLVHLLFQTNRPKRLIFKYLNSSYIKILCKLVKL